MRALAWRWLSSAGELLEQPGPSCQDTPLRELLSTPFHPRQRRREQIFYSSPLKALYDAGSCFSGRSFSRHDSAVTSTAHRQTFS